MKQQAILSDFLKITDDGIVLDRDHILKHSKERMFWKVCQNILAAACSTLSCIYFSKENRYINRFYKNSLKEIIWLFFVTYEINSRSSGAFKPEDMDFLVKRIDLFNDDSEYGVNFKANSFEVRTPNYQLSNPLIESVLMAAQSFDGLVKYGSCGECLPDLFRRIAVSDRWFRLRSVPMRNINSALLRLCDAFRIFGGEYKEIQDSLEEAKRFCEAVVNQEKEK